MTHQEKIEWMRAWAAKHGLDLELQGEVGMGRECVGVANRWRYPDFHWYGADGEPLDKNGSVWSPPDAYHKHPCVAVLGRGEAAEAQLYEWLVWFDAEGFVVEAGAAVYDFGILGRIIGKDRSLRMIRGEKK